MLPAPEHGAVRPPSGIQHEICAGAYRAVVVSGGGGVRSLSYAGRDLLDGFSVEEVPDGARGQVLAPWPNRLRDGRWRSGSRLLQLPVDDVVLGHAMHGLVRWSDWSLGQRSPERVAMHCRLHARPGYPFPLQLTVEYSVDGATGLDVRLTALNEGKDPAPVALGMHPYLAVPDGGRLEDCWVRVPGRARLLVDDRRIPTGTVPVVGTGFDLTTGDVLGDRILDECYTDLEVDGDGRVRVELRSPGGDATELWARGRVRWLQVFTGDTLVPGRRRRGLAIEPMTAPANALATGEDLAVLAPGEAVELRWGVLAGNDA